MNLQIFFTKVEPTTVCNYHYYSTKIFETSEFLYISDLKSPKIWFFI